MREIKEDKSQDGQKESVITWKEERAMVLLDGERNGYNSDGDARNLREKERYQTERATGKAWVGTREEA